ncbi:MAG: hypothetical protein SGJ00_12060 [bacterium]|jgi:hypothetical protein|nr:hypothetical protein [bacterium]
MENKQFDPQSIDGLFYNPWIGENYSQNKVLIVGDSFYFNEDNEDDEWVFSKDAPSGMVKNQGLNSEEFPTRKLFNAIEKVFYNRVLTYDERNKMWQNVAYWNLTQRPMNSRLDRPSDEDFKMGWNAFLNLAEIIKPKLVIKLAYDGTGILGGILHNENNGWDYNPDQFYIKPYKIDISKGDTSFTLLIIYHPTGSRGFINNDWNEFLNTNASGLIESLLK